MAMRTGACVLATALATLAGASASAEELLFAQAETITVTGHRPAYGEDETSTATRTETPLRDVPQAVSVITNDVIEDQAMRSMADVVRYVPGVSMGQGEGHRDAPTLRGNATTADFFVDGVRDDVQYFRDLYNAERIEVLKGPNAMIFGRGGGGGVINRVTEWADWTQARELAATVGSYDQYRLSGDIAAPLSDSFAGRLNAVYEDAASYRDFAELERLGVNPTLAARLSPETELRLGYEYFSDERTVDRGVPSQNGRPFAGSRSAFFGNPALSYSDVAVNLASVTLAHDFAPGLRLRNHTLYGDYDKFYQNVHANSPVSPLGEVTLQAYNSSTDRRNLFSQTDLIWEHATGGIANTFLLGAEFGSQETANTRAPNTAPGVVNVANPTTFAPVVFGAPLQTDNVVEAEVAAIYVQDQIALSPRWQVIAGLRFDRFAVSVDDRRPGATDFERTDEFVSPRFGLVFKPVEAASLYASYAVSYLPQSGDQFASLNATAAALEPEEFENLEVGVKWELRPDLTLTAALYRLDRTNTTAIDPVTSQTVLSGTQRSEGFELGLAGAVNERWQIIGGYTYQDAEIARSTTAAPAGRAVPLVPEHVFSLWNNVQLTQRWGVGVGVIHQSEAFASISNAVTLPSFTRVDAAAFLTLSDRIELQLNIENLLDEEYWATAHNDNNITPGSPTAARLSLRARF